MNTKNFSEAMSEVDTKYVAEALGYEKKSRKNPWVRWGAMAACLGIVALSAVTIGHFTKQEPTPQIVQMAPAADAPSGMRKFMNYHGSRYAFLDNGAVYDLQPEQLGDTLGVLEYDIQADPQANAQKEGSATYALGGTIYQMTDYDPDFRVAVQWEGQYHICQKVGQTDGTALDVPAYFEAAQFPAMVEEISIYDHAGREELRKIPGKKVVLLLEVLEQVQPAQLTDEQYQQIGRAQKEGASYQLVLSLKDGTTYAMYVIPSLNIAMIGDDRYTLPEQFAAEFGTLFEGLSQQALPAQ